MAITSAKQDKTMATTSVTKKNGNNIYHMQKQIGKTSANKTGITSAWWL